MTTTFLDDTSSREDLQVFPASVAQQRLWFLDQLEPDSATYNVPVAIRLRGLLDVSTLEASLNAIVQRHAVLRMIKAKAGEEIEHHIVPGTHMLCVTEHVQDLDACLSSCMSQVREETVNHKVGAPDALQQQTAK